MRFFLVLLCMTGVALEVVQAKFECPEEDIKQTLCLGPKDCLYPNPDRCDGFIRCEVNADLKTGRPVHKVCPEGLQWNDSNKICDWPQKSTCR